MCPDDPSASQNQDFTVILGSAEACFDGQKVTVTTGNIRRVWRVTAAGLLTVSLRREPEDREWIEPVPATGCDWRLFRLVEADARAELVDARAFPVEREGSVGERLQVELTFQYPATEVEVRYVVWAFPGANGLRTRLDLRALKQHDPKEEFWPGYLVDSYAEKLTLPIERTMRFAAGYYNDTQHRNSFTTPMLKEERREGSLAGQNYEIYDWANLLHLRRNGQGLALVKESHKCVNQEGVDTGAFVLEADKVVVTGLGLRINGYGDTAEWIRTEPYHECWANWCVLYTGDQAAGSLAVKEYDRVRFPFDAKRDVFMNANTWGSAGAGNASRHAAREENVLRELESCADLGIDVLQIDDGWQSEDGTPLEQMDWRPVPSRYPVGWRRVAARAKELGVKLGLWFAWVVPVERLRENCDTGGFLYLKLDFANLAYRHLVDGLLAKAKEIDRHNGHRGRINWDLTEVAPRMGYFLGREYGMLYLRNTQWARPGTQRTKHVEYRPEIWLRDVWQYARHLNVNQLFLNVQNKDRFDADKSGRYSHSFCFATTMMGIPTFMQETQLYSHAARDELRPLIALYKQHREKILGGYVSPIGDEPNERSWTGFHCRVSDAEGYLTVFREIRNREATAAMSLPGLPPGNYVWHDLLEETQRETLHTGVVELDCALPQPGSFRFVRYERTGMND